MMTKNLKISVITPSFQQSIFLPQTIRSVLEQNYPDLEYIIIDGGSTDGSRDIIVQYDKSISYWISEPDSGQSEAINKGLKKSTGEILAYLNSDDILLPGALEFVNRFFMNNPDVTWLCGSIIRFDSKKYEKMLLEPRDPKSIAYQLFDPYCFWQQGIFWRREVYEKIGGFDESLHYTMDYDYWTRVYIAGYRPHFVSHPLGAMRMHEASKTVSLERKFLKDIVLVRKKLLTQLTLADQNRYLSYRKKKIAMDLVKKAHNNPRKIKKFIKSAIVYPGAIFTLWYYKAAIKGFIGK